MNLTRLSQLSILGCLIGLLILAAVTVLSALQIREKQAKIATLLELRESINEFSVASDNLVMFGADQDLLRAYRMEADAIRRALEDLEEQEAAARRASGRVEKIARIVESAISETNPESGEMEGNREGTLSEAPARFRIIQQRVADQGITLDTAMNTLLRERQQTIEREATRVIMVLAGGALLFGALCVIAFGLIHKRVARPARTISDTLQRVQSGDLQARAVVEGDDELSRLADSLNQALDQRDAADAQLRQREERLKQFQELVEGSEDLCGIVDDSCRYLWVNQAYAKNYRLDPDRIQDLTLPDVLGKSYFEEVIRPRVERALEGETQRFETTRDLPGQANRLLLTRYYPIDLPGQTARHVGAVITDITDVRKAEAEVARQGRLLDMAGQAARFGAWSVDLDSNRIEWSDVVAEIHAMPSGYSPTVEEGISFYAPEHRERIDALFSVCVEKGQPYDEELQLIDAKGQRRSVRTVGEAVRDDEGRIVRVQGAFQDISSRKELESEKERLADRLAGMLEAITDGFVAFDEQWRYTYINSEAENLLGKPADELIGTTVWSQFPNLAGTQTESAIKRAMDERVADSAEEFFEPLDGWFDMRAYPWEGGVAAFFRDVTESRRMLEQVQAQEAALRASGEELNDALNTRQALINSLPAHIAMLDAEGVIIDVNEQWRHFGELNAFSGSDFGVGTNYITLCESASGDCSDEARWVADGLRDVLEGRQETFALEYPCHSPEEKRWFRVMFSRLATDEAVHTGAVAMHIDITERKQAEERINRLAYEDPLTGTLSRNGFIQALDERLEAEDGVEAGVLAMLDVVDQHDINDAHGYDTGDRLLIALGERLHNLMGDGGLVGRAGGDEFVVYRSLRNGEGTEAFLDRLEQSVDYPFSLSNDEISIEIELRIGYTSVGENRHRTKDLIREAELALFEHRRSASTGQSRIAFAEEINERARQRIQLTGELRRAIDSEEFELHFQPKVNLADGSMISAEALIRWRHPERGLLSPGLFIPVAEQSQLIGPIGDLALRSACRQLREWQNDNLEAIRVAVNVSQVQFMVGDFSAKVRSALEEFDVAPEQLSLEITESVFERHSDRLLSEIRQLHELGVRLSLDDFGTGYSSLLYLQRYPFDEIKIDRGFVNRLLDDQHSRDIVLAVMNLARALNAEVVAEGIESKEISAALLEMGCEVGQGFYYSMPLESEDFRWLLRQRSKLPLVQ